MIKLIAAIQVLFGHAVEHLELSCPYWIWKVAIYYNGVPIFFVISGFLIWFSIERSSSYNEYIKKRFWRIYPELWVAVVFEIMTIMILYAGWDAGQLAIFSVTQGTVLQFWTPDSLRGYGCGTPNGTLWTICVMVQFYLIAWIIRKLFHNRSMVVWIFSFIIMTGASIVGQTVFETYGNDTLTKLFGQTIIRFCWLFFIGCFLAEFKEKIMPLVVKFWYLFLLIGLIPYLTRVDFYAKYAVLWSMFLSTGLIGFAYKYPSLRIKTDISYGIFLYHMIIVNIFITFGWTGKWVYALFVLIISIGLAFFSTITIGSLSNRAKQKMYNGQCYGKS